MPTSRALAAAAAGAYLANVALGTAVQTGLVDTSRHRWTHHALYIVTSTLTVGAILGSFAQQSPRGWLLRAGAACRSRCCRGSGTARTPSPGSPPRPGTPGALLARGKKD